MRSKRDYSIFLPNSGDLNISNSAIDDSKSGMGFVVIFLDAPRNYSVKTKPVVIFNPDWKLQFQSSDCGDLDDDFHRHPIHPF